jgi:hypothetical protein
MISGNSNNGEMLNFSGPAGLFREIAQASDRASGDHDRRMMLRYNPDSTLPFLPADVAASMFWRYLEDEQRPRICNIVAPEASLNQEWLQYVARSAGMKEPVSYEGDLFNIPGTLRKMLLDTIQVRTRSLFEVAGRYQIPPVRLDQDYFDKVLRAGRHKRWGQPAMKERKVLSFSERLAQYYFEEFVPAQVDETLLKKATVGGTTIGFQLKGPDRLGWVVNAPGGDPKKFAVEKLDPAGERPKICFRLTGATFIQLIQCKLPLHRALLLREVEVEGPLLQALKVTNVIEQFLRDHPMHAEQFAAVSSD